MLEGWTGALRHAAWWIPAAWFHATYITHPVIPDIPHTAPLTHSRPDLHKPNYECRSNVKSSAWRRSSFKADPGPVAPAGRHPGGS